MTRQRIPVDAVIWQLEDDLWVGEALFFPEFRRVGASPRIVRRSLENCIRAAIERDTIDDVHLRIADGRHHIHSTRVDLPPAGDYLQWKREIPVTVHYVRWSTPGRPHLAFVAGLGVYVTANNPTELEQRIAAAVLARMRIAREHKSLSTVLRLSMIREITVERVQLGAEVRPPKHRVQEQSKPATSSVLTDIGRDLRLTPLEPAYEVDHSVALLAETLSPPSAQSVLLVGPSGAGKTAVFHEMVRRRDELRFSRTPFWSTSGSRIVAGMSGHGMWQQRCDNLRREASRTRAVLHLGSLVELMNVGRSESVQQSIAGFLLPFIMRGDLMCVVECTPEQLPLIEREDPHLLHAFRRVEITEPAPEAAQSILLSVALDLSHKSAQGRDLIDVELLASVDRLHRRYATYSAYPGRPLRFLRNLLADRADPVTDAEIYRAFTDETGLPRPMLDPAQPMAVEDTVTFLRERVMGQDSAVSLVADLLATIKAGLARPNRPLASYLFVGPTGVGKTETAKALAEFLFGDRGRITRFDMSEYADALSVQRLIGGVFGKEGLLTSRVRERPFSVLLFDEFEKAHHAFFDLLLQVLGEARLTDGAGRLADFRNTVVIMTSNLGAETYMRGGMGFRDEAPDAVNHFTTALRDFVRPELLNRMDRVVPFLPLDEPAVLSIVEREIDLVRKRPGLLHGATQFEVDPAVTSRIAKQAYVPALGARPIKRAIARELVAPVAEILNTQGRRGISIRATADGVESRRLPEDEAASSAWLTRLITTVQDDRRQVQSAIASNTVRTLRNELYLLERKADDLQQRKRKRKRWQEEDETTLSRTRAKIKTHAQALGLFDDALKEVEQLEDDLMAAAMGMAGIAEDEATLRHEEFSEIWSETLLTFARRDMLTPDLAWVMLHSPNNDAMFLLARAYARWVADVGLNAGAVWLTRFPSLSELFEMGAVEEAEALMEEGLVQPRPSSVLRSVPVRDVSTFLAVERELPGAIVLAVRGNDALLKLQGESGVHVIHDNRDYIHAPVEVRVYDAHPKIDDLPNEPAGEARRRYDLSQRMTRDLMLGRNYVMSGARPETVLGRCIEDSMAHWLHRRLFA